MNQREGEGDGLGGEDTKESKRGRNLVERIQTKTQSDLRAGKKKAKSRILPDKGHL